MSHTIVRVIVAVAAMTAAVLWFNSARVEVPDNIDTIVQELQRIGYWNGWAARCSCIAAFLGAVDVVLTTIERPLNSIPRNRPANCDHDE
jgi:hypothetical protein